MIRSEGHLCSIYCGSVRFLLEQRTGTTDLFLYCPAELDLHLLIHPTCPLKERLCSTCAVKYYTYIALAQV